VCFAIARVAEALGRATEARLALRRVAELGGGHRRVGDEHSAECLARLLVSRPLRRGNREAIELLLEARREEPDLATEMLVELLIADGRRDEAIAVVDAALAADRQRVDAAKLTFLRAVARSRV